MNLRIEIYLLLTGSSFHICVCAVLKQNELRFTNARPALCAPTHNDTDFDFQDKVVILLTEAGHFVINIGIGNF